MNQKTTIYIDIDDEITSIIDKMRGADARVVALVLPKRAAMLQSSVNMKLLKKAAEAAKKQPVLITSEAGLLPLAGSVGLHVAQTLQSKPEIPIAAPAARGELDELLSVNEADLPSDFDPRAAAAKPVGELAGKSAAVPTMPLPDHTAAHHGPEPDETIKLGALSAADAKADKAAKSSKNKQLKVPNFNRFRKRLLIGGLVIVGLIVLFILSNTILPRATIAIATKTSSVNASLLVTLDSTAQSVNPSQGTIPAQIQQTQKTETQQVAATGQKNEGNAATGQVTVTEQTAESYYYGCTSATSLPAGTSITTSGGVTFIITPAVTFPKNPSGGTGGKCSYTSGSVPVTAQNAGQLGSNLPASGTSFTVNNSAVEAMATASGNFTDGTNDIVQIVAQADINNATQQLASPNSASIKSSLANNLTAAGYYAVQATFSAGTPAITSSAQVGDQANNVTVTETITYSLFGVKKADLQTLLNQNINSQINTGKQSIQNDGLSGAKLSVVSQSATSAQIRMTATATTGPHLDISSLKQQVAGKKSGQIQALVANDPGVTGVTVHYSPFWVTATPKSTSKITIKFVKG